MRTIYLVCYDLAGFSVCLVKDATGYDGSVSPSSPIERPA
jgi:hypothetical protein